MAQNTWRKKSLFDGTIDPFSPSSTALSCDTCGHLSLYSTETKPKTKKPCTNCTGGTMSPTSSPVSIPNHVYNPQQGAMQNGNAQPQSTQNQDGTRNVNISFNPNPTYSVKPKRMKKKSQKSKRKKPPTLESKPKYTVKSGHGIQANNSSKPQKYVQQKHNTKYQKRQQKFQSLIQRNYKSIYNKPLPQTKESIVSATSDPRYSRHGQSIQQSTTNTHSTPNIHAHAQRSGGNASNKKPQQYIYNNNHSNKPNLMRSTSSREVDKRNKTMPNKPALRTSHSAMEASETREKQNRGYDRYPHRGPPINFDEFFKR